MINNSIKIGCGATSVILGLYFFKNLNNILYALLGAIMIGLGLAIITSIK